MKNVIPAFAILLLLLQSCTIIPKTWTAQANPTAEQLSLTEAYKIATEFKQSHPKREVIIELASGDHHISKPLVADNNMRRVTIRAIETGKAWIKGSKKIEVQWKKKGLLLYTSIDEINSIDQVFIDGRAQTLARYPDYNEKGGHWQGHAPDVISPERISGWSKPIGAIVHAMHGSEWGDFHFVISGIDQNGEAILKGGHQNNRPSRMHKDYLMVENVFEELDSPGEWYYDSEYRLLYWYPDIHPENMNSLVEIPVLKELVIVRGSEGQSVSEFKIQGVGFSHSKRTFMEDYEPLLRSDWTTYRGGAIFLEGVEDCEISDCEFTHLGGNGIFLSGFARRTKIIRNHIYELGASGICLVGKPSAVRSPSFQYSKYVPLEEMDTLKGPKTDHYPAECLIENNLIYRIGRIEKQVAGIQLSMCMDITIRHNSIYELPRAGINISEGTWGGHLLEYNDVFKTVQESGDHGSFNSWGRDRFWHPNRGVLDSITIANPNMPLWDAIHTTIIRNNRFRCDHGWDIDLDDGSSNYEIYNNLCLNGGIKLREGFYRRVENNIMVNNGFHPHVWFSNSKDIFRKNIVMTEHKDIRLAAWGQEVDYNFFPDGEALAAAQENGTDKNSLFGNPDFIAPEKGDFRVSETSMARKIGFTNFPMDKFGVQVERLKNIRQEPIIPALHILDFQKEKLNEREWLGARIKNIENLSERSASGLPDESGVLVISVLDDGLAKKAGIIEGDVIIACENKPVKKMRDLLTIHQGNNWKGHLGLLVFRNQSEIKIDIKTK